MKQETLGGTAVNYREQHVLASENTTFGCMGTDNLVLNSLPLLEVFFSEKPVMTSLSYPGRNLQNEIEKYCFVEQNNECG